METNKDICRNCQNQKSQGRGGQPHPDLKLIDKEMKMSTFGSNWEDFTYVCQKCGAMVHHNTDRDDFPPFWTVTPKREQ